MPLPPRARGKHCQNAILMADDPSTPACAGQTWRACLPNTSARLYPRVRGANSSSLMPLAMERPLPPPARGKRQGSRGHPFWKTSTPACAGQTQQLSLEGIVMHLYPRLRGANLFTGPSRRAGAPLPPPARGKPLAKPHNTAGSYSRAPRFSFTANPLASSGTRHTPSKTTGPATASSKMTVR